jgi:hypothetical protein
MKRLLFLICLFLISIIDLWAQEDKVLSKNGMLRATAGIEPGILLNSGQLTTYISGLLEYHLQERVSVRGDVSMYFNLNNSSLLNNHGLYFGALYHFTDKALIDPYIGLQPGVHLSRFRYTDDLGTSDYRSNFRVLPVASIVGGLNCYVSRFFNFYISSRAVFGTFSGGGAPLSMPLHELRINFGLGFNLSLKKK